MKYLIALRLFCLLFGALNGSVLEESLWISSTDSIVTLRTNPVSSLTFNQDQNESQISRMTVTSEKSGRKWEFRSEDINRKCLGFEEFGQGRYTWEIHTHFYNRSFYEFRAETKEGQQISVRSQEITSFQIDMSGICDLVKPMSINEGKKYYNHYAIQHLDTGYSLCETTPPSLVHIFTTPRSGTHLLVQNMEAVLGIFFSSPYPLNSDRKSWEEGQAIDLITNVPFLWSHHSVKVSMKRRVFLVRDPMENIDSYFHFHAFRGHTHKLSDSTQYWKDDIYKRFVDLCARQFQLISDEALTLKAPVLVVRYEDLVHQPVDVISQSIGFTIGVPTHLTVFQEKLKKHIGNYSLSSYYRTFDHDEWIQKGKKLVKKMGSDFIMMIYQRAKFLIYFHGYYERFEETLNIEQKEREENRASLNPDGYLEVNQENERLVFTYDESLASRVEPKPQNRRNMFAKPFGAITQEIWDVYAKVRKQLYSGSFK